MTDGASFSYDGNVTLNYNTLVNEKHIIYAGAGLEVTQNDNNSHGFIMTGFPDDRYSDPAFAIQYKKETKPSSSVIRSSQPIRQKRCFSLIPIVCTIPESLLL